MNCPACGADVDRGDEFCSSCGTELEFEGAAPSEENRQQPSTGGSQRASQPSGGNGQPAPEGRQGEQARAGGQQGGRSGTARQQGPQATTGRNQPAQSGAQRAPNAPTGTQRQQSAATGGGGLPIIKGAVFGALAYVVGLITFVAILLGSEERFLRELSGQGGFKVLGWFYYNAQFVNVEQPGGGSFNLFDQQFLMELLSIPPIVYRLVPIALLFVAGYLLATSHSARTSAQGAKSGATIAVGAVALAVAGTFVFSVSQGTQSMQPNLVNSVLVMGVVYPVVFGGIGGYLAGS